MKRVKRSISFVLMLLFVGVGVAGCALFERDANAYNNLVVAQIGDDITISKKELVDAFNRFGNQYISSQGMSISDAYDETLNALIHREIMAKLSANTFGFGDAASGHVKYVDLDSGQLRVGVTNQEAESARKASFTVMENTLKEMEKRARESKKVANRTEEVTTPQETVHDVYKKYEKFMYKDPIAFEVTEYDSTMDTDGKITMVATNKKRRVVSDYRLNLDKYKNQSSREAVMTNEQFIERLKMSRNANSSLENTIAQDAFKRLVSALKENEKGIKYSGADAEDEAYVMRELVRMQKEEEKNILLRRMQECFEHGITEEADYNVMLDIRNGGNFNKYEAYVSEKNYMYLNDLVKRAEDDYIQKVSSAIDRYERGFDTVDTYRGKILDSLEDVYFVPQKVANQYFTVSHILLKYTAEQDERLKQIKEQYAQDRNEKNKEAAMDILKSQVKIMRRDSEGKEVGNPMSTADVLAYVQNRVMPDSKTKSLQDKVNDFRDCIYMFNMDDGMKNPKFEYVLGADLRKDKTPTSAESDTMSGMLPEFTKGARELFNYNETTGRGGVKEVKTLERRYENGQWNVVGEKVEMIDTRGTMSELVWTDYGAHIIMYTRNIGDFIYTNSRSMLEQTYEYYLHATHTSYGNKTTFDAIVEGLNKPAYTNYEEGIIASFKGNNVIKINKTNYRDLRNQRV